MLQNSARYKKNLISTYMFRVFGVFLKEEEHICIKCFNSIFFKKVSMVWEKRWWREKKEFMVFRFASIPSYSPSNKVHKACLDGPGPPGWCLHLLHMRHTRSHTGIYWQANDMPSWILPLPFLVCLVSYYHVYTINFSFKVTPVLLHLYSNSTSLIIIII